MKNKKTTIEIFEQMPSNGIIGDRVHIAFAHVDNKLVRAYIGTEQSGPMLTWVAPDELYNGHNHEYYPDGGWSPIYSHGNYGKRYAYGGTWSIHSKSICPRIAAKCKPAKDREYQIMLIGDNILALPDGIQGELTMSEIDCSVGWAIYYESPQQALQERLTYHEIVTYLPGRIKKHLLTTELPDVRDNVWDAIEAYFGGVI